MWNWALDLFRLCWGRSRFLSRRLRGTACLEQGIIQNGFHQKIPISWDLLHHLHPYSCSRMAKARWSGWCHGESLVLAQSCLASTRTYPTTEIGSMRLWVDERRNSKQDSFWRYGCDSHGGASDSCLEGNNEWITKKSTNLLAQYQTRCSK